MKNLAKIAFHLYRLLTANSSHHCRFTPTCSQFAQESIEKYGIIKGSTLAFARLLSCHPFSNRPVYDPIP